jgi:hypothetical protein
VDSARLFLLLPERAWLRADVQPVYLVRVVHGAIIRSDGRLRAILFRQSHPFKHGFLQGVAVHRTASMSQRRWLARVGMDFVTSARGLLFVPEFFLRHAAFGARASVEIEGVSARTVGLLLSDFAARFRRSMWAS